MLEQQCNKESADAAIAVKVGMDGFELNMRQPNANQWRQPVFRMKILLKLCQERRQVLWRRGNENGVAGTRSANPVLSPANLSRLLVGTSDSAHQAAMCLIQ